MDKNILSILQSIDSSIKSLSKNVNTLIEKVKETNSILGTDKNLQSSSEVAYELPKATKKRKKTKGLEIEQRSIIDNHFVNVFPSLRETSRQLGIPFSTLHNHILEREPYTYYVAEDDTYLQVKH